MAISERVVFPVSFSDWNRTSKFIILSMITCTITQNAIATWDGLTNLKDRIWGVPAAGATHDGIEACCKISSKGIDCFDSCRVFWISKEASQALKEPN